MSNFLKNLHPLLRRSKNKKDNQDPNYALINMLNEEMNLVEKDAIKSKLQSSLKTATGAYLDKFGDWFGVYRKPNEDDEKYRERIIEYLLLKRGTNNSIIKAIRDYLEKEDAYVSVYEPYKNIFYTNKSHLNGEDHLMGYYYRFAIINISIGCYFPVEILDVINKFKPAGVQVYLTYKGQYTNTGSPVLKLLEGLPKITTYTRIRRLSGFGDIFYGHFNLSERKEYGEVSTEVFNTNKSKINSSDVLAGSSNVGRSFYNYAYYSIKELTPTQDSYVTTTLTDTDKELPVEYYSYTKELDNYIVNYTLPKTYSVKFLYHNFNLGEYFSKYKEELLTGNKKQNIIDFVGKVNYSVFLKALVPPTENVTIDVQVYDFSTRYWNTISTKKLSNVEINIGSEVGFLTDYINDNLNIFTRLRIREYDSVELKLNYIDLSFSNYMEDTYTEMNFIDNIYNVKSNISAKDYLNMAKVTLLTNEDIMSNRAYFPSQYIKISDTFDNAINRNILLNSKDTKLLPNISGRGISTQNNDKSWTVTPNEGNTVSVFFRLKQEGNTITEYPIPLNEWYTFSMDVVASEDINLNISVKNTQHYTSRTKSKNYILQEGKKTRITHTFKIINDVPEIIFTFIANIADATITYDNIKLEQGTIGGKWQPNPQDIYGKTSPNNSLTITAESNSDIPVPVVDTNQYEEITDKNLLKSYANEVSINNIIKNTNNFEFTGWAVNLYTADYLSKVLEEGKTYTIHYEMEITESVDSALKPYSKKHGLFLYSAKNNTDNVDMSENIESVVGNTVVKSVTFTCPKIVDHRIIAYSGLYSSDGTPNLPRYYNKTNIRNLKLQEGSEYTGWKPSLEDTVNFLDKRLKFYGARTDIKNIKVTSSTEFKNAKFNVSTYGRSYKPIKTFDISQGETTVINEFTDLYGLSIIDYSDINPMSEVILQSIWDIPIDTITSKTGELNGLYKDFFNTTWQYIGSSNKEVFKYNTLNVLRNVVNGTFNNSTGEILKLTSLKVSTPKTSVIYHTERQMVYDEPLIMDSDIIMSNTTHTIETESYSKDTSYLRNIF